jgi:hypothetical protein
MQRVTHACPEPNVNKIWQRRQKSSCPVGAPRGEERVKRLVAPGPSRTPRAARYDKPPGDASGRLQAPGRVAWLCDRIIDSESF